MSVVGAFHQVALAETYLDEATGLIKVNDSLPLTPSFGAIWYRSIDLGFPDVRSSMQDRPEADGSFDETRFHGARSLSFEGIVLQNAFGNLPTTWGWPTDVDWNNASYWISQLSSWASPAKRFKFYFTDENGRSRFMEVRGDNFSAQTAQDDYSFREFQLGMVNPSGRIYSFATGTGTTEDGRWEQFITLESNASGRPYPRDYDITYPPGASGSTFVKYNGTVPTGCLIRIFTGSSTIAAPRVTFTAPDGTQQSVGFSPFLTVPANTMLSIDTLNRTVYTRATDSLFSLLIPQYLQAPLQWPQLKPGMNKSAADVSARSRGYNKVEFDSSSSLASDARLSVVWHDADLF